MLVQTKSKQRNPVNHFEFDTAHPKSETYVLVLACTGSQIATVIFYGQLTHFQTAEASRNGGHPITDAIMNDLAKIFLGTIVFAPNDIGLFRALSYIVMLV